jgi:S-adenosyl-L-methionine hydrolase (adenosine-forming)
MLSSPTALPRPVSFLSDYGLEDEFVGVCHGVIQRIAPGAVIIDIAHALPPYQLRPAAVVLRNALPYMPAGVHLAVVDPGVGGARRALALRCGDRFLVGPDNGLLWPAAERLGGVDEAVDLTRGSWNLEPVSDTFHGRDVFAPAAAHLALGEPLGDGGEPLDPAKLLRLELPIAIVGDGEVTAHVLHSDRFGNVQLDATAADMERAGLEHGSSLVVDASVAQPEALYARTFEEAEAGALIVYEDSYRAIAVALNRGSAAAALGLKGGDHVRLARAQA